MFVAAGKKDGQCCVASVIWSPFQEQRLHMSKYKMNLPTYCRDTYKHTLVGYIIIIQLYEKHLAMCPRLPITVTRM